MYRCDLMKDCTLILLQRGISIMAKEQVKNRLEQDSIGKLMLELCTQTTFSIMIYNIYTITDTFYVSKGIGSVASGAIGVFSPVLLLVNGSALLWERVALLLYPAGWASGIRLAGKR